MKAGDQPRRIGKLQRNGVVPHDALVEESRGETRVFDHLADAA